MSRVRLNDHAFARYCERALGIDRQALEKALADTLKPFTDGRHKLPGIDVVAIVDRGALVTFVPFSTPPHTAKAKPKKKKVRVEADEPWIKV